MSGRSAVLWMTHLWSPELGKEFEALLRAGDPNSMDIWLMADARTPGAADLAGRFRRCHLFSERELFRRLPYPHPEGVTLYDTVHYALLDFYLSHPEYDYYWVIEFDVRYTGEWGSFLHSFDASVQDLITCHIRNSRDEPDWWWWDTLRHPEKTIDRTEYLRSFNVLYRMSHLALSLIHEAQKDGWQGHPEVLIPTLLKNGACSLLDIGGDGVYTPPGMRNRFYTSGSTRDGRLNPFCSLRFRPSRGAPGLRRNKIYHPVKPGDSREPFLERVQYFRNWTCGYIRELLNGQHTRNKV